MSSLAFVLFFVLSIFCLSIQLTGHEIDGEDAKESDEKKKEEPPKIGNFSLPSSQQPSGLFAFGGNIIDKNEIQVFTFCDDFQGKNKTTTDIIPNVIFGVTDNFSVLLAAPFTTLLKDGPNRSKGLEDFFIQLEYAFYNNSTKTYVDQATILGNVRAPTGSIKKTPPTGFGTPSCFIGTTFYRTWVDWVAFTAQGAIITASGNRSKLGNQFFYEFGIAKTIPSPKGWIFAGMLEVDGQYNQQNKINGNIDPNSGGNSIFVTPSIWISSKELQFQCGVSFPINQYLFGKQRKFDYALNINVAWSFY